MSRPTPPFTDEHEELRESARGFIERELAPHAAAVGGGALVPRRGLRRKLAAQGLLGLKYPERVRRPGRRLPARGGARARRWRASARAARRRASARTSTSPRRRSGSSAPSEQKQRYLVPAIARRADRRARDHRARRRLGRRRARARAPSASTAAASSTARRRTSPTACARTSSSPPSRRRAEGGHHGISFLIVDRGEGVDLVEARRSSAGTPRTRRRSPSRTSSCPRRTCSASSTRASS